MPLVVTGAIVLTGRVACASCSIDRTPIGVTRIWLISLVVFAGGGVRRVIAVANVAVSRAQMLAMRVVGCGIPVGVRG